MKHDFTNLVKDLANKKTNQPTPNIVPNDTTDRLNKLEMNLSKMHDIIAELVQENINTKSKLNNHIKDYNVNFESLVQICSDIADKQK